MSDEISNKTLAMLLLVAIVVSLAGTFMSLNKLATLRFPAITGFATDTGTADVDIQSEAGITFSTNSIDFGEGYTNGSQTGDCSLWTTAGGGQFTGADVCLNFSTGDYPNALEIDNTGNEDLEVNLTLSTSAASFIGGTDPHIQFQGEAAGGTPCTGTLETSWTELSATTKSICDEMDASDPNGIYVHLNITIPVDSTEAGGQATLTATGTTIA